MPTEQTITYNGLELFSSGPSRTEPGELAGRDAVTQTPGAIGATLIRQGTEPRVILQHGTLVADSTMELQTLVDQIASQIAQGQAELLDEHGQAWNHCVMRSFNPSGFNRLGPRYSAKYTITYLQTHP